MLNLIIEKIDEIDDVLISQENTNYELFKNGGELLFYYELAKYKKTLLTTKQFEDKLFKFISNFQKTNNITLGDGIFGNFWLVNYFIKEGILDENLVSEIAEQSNLLFERWTDEFCLSKNYDFFHGLLGLLYVGNYCDFIDKRKVIESANKMAESLIINSDGTGYFSNWLNVFLEEKTELNFGLSHGLPSFASIFSKLNYPDYKFENYAISIMGFILKYKEQFSTTNNYPLIIKQNQIVVREGSLAWCYSDLGVACAFWNVGKQLNISSYKDEAIDLLLKCSKRRDIKKENIIDGCICHGTAGIAHVFNQFYKETRIKEFDEARWYWANETLSIAKFNDGLAGYKSWKNKNGWQSDTGLLDGVSGIGLVLLGFLNEEKSNWDQCLLIS